MACFLVPAGEAIVTTIAAKEIKKKEKADHENMERNEISEISEISFSEKLGWLNKMLWGGSGLLAFEHLWHGEISPFFPFLTAISDPADTLDMLHEMATSGTGMAVLVTAVWGIFVLSLRKMQKNEEKLKIFNKNNL